MYVHALCINLIRLCIYTVLCRLKLEWVDHLEVPTVKKKSGELLEVGNVFIEATITNGGAFLTPILSCSEYKFASVVRFTQWLKTQLKVKNIPKVISEVT